MALILPSLDMEAGTLNITYAESSISISLATLDPESAQTSASRVCGDKINALVYPNPDVSEFFSKAIGVPCTLARFPASLASKRHFKPHLTPPQNGDTTLCAAKQPPILLSNESPMLLINRSSVDHLNELIKDTGGKAAQVDVFRANIVIAETGPNRAPYAEDTWKHVQIGREYIEVRYYLSFFQHYRHVADFPAVIRPLSKMSYGLYRPANRCQKRRAICHTIKNKMHRWKGIIWSACHAPP